MCIYTLNNIISPIPINTYKYIYIYICIHTYIFYTWVGDVFSPFFGWPFEKTAQVER